MLTIIVLGVIVIIIVIIFPGHPLDTKDLQRHEGDGLLVSIQERRAAVVPRLGRL